MPVIITNPRAPVHKGRSFDELELNVLYKQTSFRNIATTFIKINSTTLLWFEKDRVGVYLKGRNIQNSNATYEPATTGTTIKIEVE